MIGGCAAVPSHHSRATPPSVATTMRGSQPYGTQAGGAHLVVPGGGACVAFRVGGRAALPGCAAAAVIPRRILCVQRGTELRPPLSQRPAQTHTYPHHLTHAAMAPHSDQKPSSAAVSKRLRWPTCERTTAPAPGIQETHPPRSTSHPPSDCAKGQGMCDVRHL